MIEPAGPRRARRSGSAEPTPKPTPAPPPARRPVGRLVALVLVSALAGGLVASLATVVILSNQARANSLNLRTGVTVTEESSTVQVIANAQPSVVSVVTRQGGGTITSGSGFIVSGDGNIVTNVRVIANSESLTVLLANSPKPRDARVVDYDCETGVAVLKVDGVSNLKTLSFGDSNALKLGQSLVAMGGPLQGSAQRGIVSGLHRTVAVDGKVNTTRTDRLSDTLQTDATIDDSSSGGPLLNVSGQVVGIAVAATSNRQPLAFGIAANDVRAVVDQIVQSGQLVLPWLGVDSVVVDAATAQLLGTAVGSQVKDVTIGSPADLAGIRAGDVITQLDAYKLDDAHPLPQVLRTQYKPSQRAIVNLWRAGGTSQVELTLGSQHPICQ